MLNSVFGARRALLSLGCLLLFTTGMATAAPLDTTPAGELDRPRSERGLEQELVIALPQGTEFLRAKRWLVTNRFRITDEVESQGTMIMEAVIDRGQGLPIQGDKMAVLFFFDQGYRLTRITVTRSNDPFLFFLKNGIVY